MNIERHTRLQQQSLALLPTATEIASINAAVNASLLPTATKIASINAAVNASLLPTATKIASINAALNAALLPTATKIASINAALNAALLPTATEIASINAAVNASLLPTATKIASINAALARAVEPYWAVIASVSAWEASLTARMAALGNPWALQDRLDQSMRGFARLSRLSDAVHTSRPYSEPVGELVANELGVGVEADLYDDTPIERDENAVKAGFNPELIAFPTAAYGEVVLAAGFKFHFTPAPVPQAVESPDLGAVFDPMHGAVLIVVEQRLRHIVTERLSGLDGRNWFKHRVSKAVRNRCLDRQEQERQACPPRPVFDPIQYADFMDLADIIGRSDNWREEFKSIFQNQEDFLVSLKRLHPIRKAIAHSRPLGKSDVLILVNEAARIFSALEIRVLS